MSKHVKKIGWPETPEGRDRRLFDGEGKRELEEEVYRKRDVAWGRNVEEAVHNALSMIARAYGQGDSVEIVCNRKCIMDVYRVQKKWSGWKVGVIAVSGDVLGVVGYSIVIKVGK